MIKNLEVGQIISVDVFKPNRGSYPIGRYEGIICKLFLPDNIKFLEYGCTVNAIVGVINDRSISVQVIDVCKSAADNAYETEKAMAALTNRIKESKTHSIKL